MDEIQDILVDIAINSGNAEKQLAALQRGIGTVESQLKNHKDFRLGLGSAEYSEIKNKIR